MKYYELAIKSLHERLIKLEERIKTLEEENVGMTNELYELQNKLDILDTPKYEHLKGLEDFTLGQ